MGKITKEQLSESLLEMIRQAASSGSSMEFKKHTATLVGTGNRIDIGIPDFDKTVDLLMVYKNTVYLEEDIVYTVTADNLSIVKNEGTWESGSLFNFVVFKHGGNITSENIANELRSKINNLTSEVNETKSQLETNITNQGNLTNLSTTNKTDLVQAINEVFQDVSNGKKVLASALTDRNVDTLANDTFNTIAKNIMLIGNIDKENLFLLNILFDNNTIGSIQGSISLKVISDGYFGMYDIYWSDIDGNQLQGYDKLCTIDLTNTKIGKYDILNHRLIPNGAKKIMAKNRLWNEIVALYTIPVDKLITKEPNYKFGLLSDIHVRTEDLDVNNSFEKITKCCNHFKDIEGIKDIVVAGDIISSGTLGEMERFNVIKDSFTTMNFHCARGNHDTYSESTIDNFKKYINSNGFYYETTIGSDIFLFVGLTMEDNSNLFSRYVLDWLEETLEKYKNRRVFLIQHVFIEPVGNANELYPFDGLINTQGTMSRRFIDMVAKYRNAVHISGHSHLPFDAVKFHPFANCSERTDILCHRIHTPSATRPREVGNSIEDGVTTNLLGSQGWVVDVYDDIVVLRGYDWEIDSPVQYAQYVLNTTPITIESVDTVPEYSYTNKFTTYQSGSLSSDGEDRTSSGSKRSNWISAKENDNPLKNFKMPSGVTYLRVCYYDINKVFIRVSKEDIYNDGKRIPSGTLIDDITDDVYYIKFKGSGTVEEIEYNGYLPAKGVKKEPPFVSLPPFVNYPEPEVSTPPTDTLELSKWKCINFIERQMNVSSFKSPINLEIYQIDNTYAIKGTVGSLENPFMMRNKYISIDSDYDINYVGKISGKWYSNLKNPEDYRIDVYTIVDTKYFVSRCNLNPDGTWESIRDASLGIKHVELIEKKTGVIVEYGYPIISNYKIKLFEFIDVEYEICECPIYIKNNKFEFYTTDNNFGNSINDKKIIAKLYNDSGKVSGIGGEFIGVNKGRLPSSYLIPDDDPNFDKDGNTALGINGYMLNSRSYIYDIGLTLLVFTDVGRFDICKEIMDRLYYEQNVDGSFNFSYDLYIGGLYEPYVRTGSVGWLVWGMCKYIITSGDNTYTDMINKVGEWLLKQQVIDSSDLRHGLLKGGYGSYDNDYNYTDASIEWCSTEHNCSTVQAINGLYKITNDIRYMNCQTQMIESISTTLYDSTNGRFYQGVTSSGIDEAWSIDCLTWASTLIHSTGDIDKAIACESNLDANFLVENTNIIISTVKERYNTKYYLNDEDKVTGYKPYHLGYNNPPQLMWTEGTLGVALLKLRLGKNEDFTKCINEIIKLQNCNGSSGGIIYTTETRSEIPWEFHVWESTTSACWLYLLLSDPSVLFKI